MSSLDDLLAPQEVVNTTPRILCELFYGFVVEIHSAASFPASFINRS
jgi:hypothetical protein